jgi:ABC-type thiamin/hydroxymethylpyrimidine transport system permease subunit
MKMPSKQFYITWGIWFLASFVAVFILDGFGAEFAALVAAEASTLYAATILFFPFP